MTPQQAGKVAVMMGGNSPERDISMNSGAAVLESLRRQGFDAHPVDTAKPFIQQFAQGEYQRAFIAVHGAGGEDGSLQAVLDILGVPYTGSGMQASAVAFDKAVCKSVWCVAGLPTADFIVLRPEPGVAVDPELIPFSPPWAVKPARGGSSMGVSMVEDTDSFAAALRGAAEYDDRVIVEQWMQGGEYTAGILCGQVLPVVKLETPRGFYDYVAKYEAGDTSYICPCGLEAEQEQAIMEIALQAFTAVAASTWGRVDFIVDAAGTPYLLELNTVPGMTGDSSLVPKAAEHAGISFDELVLAILDSADTVEGTAYAA